MSLVANDGQFLLVEITLTHPVGPLSAHVPAGTGVLLGEKEIHVAREPGAARQVDHAAQALAGMFFGDDIDNAHVAFRVVLGRWRGDDLDVLDMARRNLLERLRTGKDAGLAVDVDQEAAAATESDVALGVYTD